jgi:hypothetical protein
MRKDEFDIVEKYAQKKTTKALAEAYEEVCATRNGITGDTEYILGVRVGLSMARDIIAYHARKEEDETE